LSTVQFKQLSVKTCRHGTMVWPKSDSTIGRALDLYGEFAEGENIVMARYLTSGDIAVDVGANLGTTVLPLAHAVGSAGRVIAFEPQPLMAQCLQTSLTLNEIFHVQVISAAMAESSGWAKIPTPSVTQGGNYGSMALSEVGLQVSVIALDELELPSLKLLKIDVEGFEWAVIQGARKQLLKHQPVVYLEAKRIPGTTAYLDWLLANGWRCYWHFAFFYRADNFRKNAENIFDGTGDMNVLAVPQGYRQPEDLPEIEKADEDWQQVYGEYFRRLGRPLP